MSLRPIFNRLIDPLVSLLYPQFCTGCGKSIVRLADGPACADCWAATRIFGDHDLLCGKCGAFLAEGASHLHPDCGECGDHFYDAARAAGLYERAITAAVLQMKSAEHVPRTVRDHLIAAFERMELNYAPIVVPVPLSKQRAHERGFNQAEILAKVISEHAGLNMDPHSLVRRGDTPMHRAAMDRKAREATVKNVFEVVRPALINGGDILLIDDLMTSGATASQCAKALKKSGAGKVIVLTLARAG